MILKHFNEPENQILAAEVNQLRILSEENEIYFQQTKRIWETSAETKRLEGIDVRKSVSSFRARLDEATYIEPRRLFSWTKVAAAAVVVIAVGIWIYSKETAVNYIVKNTSSAIDSVLLNDGSKVILAANSTIRYPEKFTDDLRPLDLLKGKAFFLVAKDSKRPFEVAIGNSTVKVLGTSFNINYSESSIDLSVKTGKVMFTPNEKSKPSILEAGQGLNYRYVENTLQMNKDDNAAAWFTKELRFVDTPLDEVCRQLSEYYNVRIELHDQKLTAKKFNANFKNTSLEEALTALKETYSINIKLADQKIIIKSL
ncbi:FecR family protein [Pedobacter caeni]|uniref:FecR family protein n=1 Tax=Pedobacter caeni TaxID=288992 RepID=A0A1M5DHU6_9SPHI|nr:FecR domain-containing protein [Pedobacter caeni]SHF66563.1 FecR family protein [Pedobacter caeni]